MNKTVLITGASRGIGRAIALAFAKAGYYVIGTYISANSKEKICSLAQEINSLYNDNNRFTYFKCDHSSFSANQDLINTLTNSGISIDILINNAGISIVGLAQDITEEDWNTLWNTNVTSVVSLSKAVIPGMLNKGGYIINISSVWGNVGASCETAYSATKGAINSYTKALAKELAPSGITVNAVACGMIETEMNSHLSEVEKAAIAEEIPIGRIAVPDEIATTILTLISSPSYLTGQVITIDGGWT